MSDCWQVGYDTAREARDAMLGVKLGGWKPRWRRESKGKQARMQVYHCAHCGKWHYGHASKQLTTRNRRVWK